MNPRIGRRERKILDWLRVHPGSAELSEVCSKFAHWRHKAGDRTGYSDFSGVIKVLERMEGKGLITISNRGRTDCAVHYRYRGPQ